MGGYGCFITSIANVMWLAGHATTPGDVCDALNANNGFKIDPDTGEHTGLAIWANVTQAFPFFRFDGGPYRIAQGYNALNGGNHWWTVGVTGVVYDPWTGNSTHPINYLPTGYANGVSCDTVFAVVPASVSVPVVPHFDPFLVDLSPNQDYNPEVVRMQRYLTAKGVFVDAGPQDGWYGPRTAQAVHDFQVSKGLYSATQFGWWYPLTRGFANDDLSHLTTS